MRRSPNPPPSNGVDVRRLGQVQTALLAWFRENGAVLPWRTRRDPYAVLVSEFMLQQTQRARVAPKFVEFMERFPDLHSLALASTADVIRAWAGLGYNGRAVRLHRLARGLVAAGAGVPSDLQALRRLPGVGDYTARAVACFGFDQDFWLVDTNVSRVLRRVLHGEPDPKPLKSMDAELAAAALPSGQAFAWNSALMDLGAAVCVARAPRCSNCPLRTCCLARPVVAQPESEGRSRLVAEGRPGYMGRKAAKRPARAPFRSTTRYLRGRIVDALRALAPGEALDGPALALAATGMALPTQDERVLPLLEALVNEGVIAAHSAEGSDTLYSLPE